MVASPEQILKDRDAEIASIRRKVEWTEQYKDERIAEVHEWARREYAEAREAEAQRIQDRLESTKRAAFSIPTGYGSSYAEEAQIHHLFRAALAEVKAATENTDNASEAEALDALLGQAELTGDHLLARAVYHHAIALRGQQIDLSDGRSISLGGDGQKIVDRYLANNPEDAKKWQAYTEAAAEAQEASSIKSMLNTGLMNREFASPGATQGAS
jgi:hypothetical protein